MSTNNKLYYVYDPMCSWCWGYKPVWQKVSQQLESKIEIQYVLGGLAPDSDQPMPEEMQHQIASYWKKIEDFLGTEFNYDFWQKNTPRRSTYPSCRAVLAARKQGAEQAMLSAIQHAYYLEARNPSDNEVLLSLAANIGLDTAKFEVDFFSAELNQEFLQELEFARRIGGNSFPSLFVANEQGIIELQVDYQSAEATIEQVEQILSW
ncbi:DsbA family protein [Vibrio sp. M260112]|uniref:DsbA family protein n=1 Tax=Vibrio sp. M260112 TaxID=3020895 RepID=UPI002F40E0BF